MTINIRLVKMYAQYGASSLRKVRMRKATVYATMPTPIRTSLHTLWRTKAQTTLTAMPPITMGSNSRVFMAESLRIFWSRESQNVVVENPISPKHSNWSYHLLVSDEALKRPSVYVHWVFGYYDFHRVSPLLGPREVPGLRAHAH